MTEQNKPTPDRFERAKQILDTVNAEFPGHPLGWNSGRPWLELADKSAPANLSDLEENSSDFHELLRNLGELATRWENLPQQDKATYADAIRDVIHRYNWGE